MSRWLRAASRLLIGGWSPPAASEPGYAILVPVPADMPFLLRYALEGIRALNTEHCREILAVGDGRRLRGLGSGLELAEPRLRILPTSLLDYAVCNLPREDGGANFRHWLTIVRGVDAARSEHVYLHDADAFWLERDGVERQYLECVERGLASLGVTERWDAFLAEEGVTIPGTWELVFRRDWARAREPWALKGQVVETPGGPREFDTMLWAQYADHDSGRIAVMEQPPGFVHFSGAITAFRRFARGRGRELVDDDLFRILLLSVLEELSPPVDGRRCLPPVEELRRGLADPTAEVRYASDRAVRSYPEFRKTVDRLCRCEVFAGERAERIRSLLRPFDEHMAEAAMRRPELREPPEPEFRRFAITTTPRTPPST